MQYNVDKQPGVTTNIKRKKKNLKLPSINNKFFNKENKRVLSQTRNSKLNLLSNSILKNIGKVSH